MIHYSLWIIWHFDSFLHRNPQCDCLITEDWASLKQLLQKRKERRRKRYEKQTGTVVIRGGNYFSKRKKQEQMVENKKINTLEHAET